MTELAESAKYPTIERLSDLSRGTIVYQGPDLVSEAVKCWHELKEANERADRNHLAYEEAQGWVKKWAADCGRLEAKLAWFNDNCCGNYRDNAQPND